VQIRTVKPSDVTEWGHKATVMGKDIGEVMDRAGVLLTPQRLCAIRASVINQIAQGLEDTPTAALLKGRGYKPGDLPATDFQAVLATTLRDMANVEYERSRKK
jgi:hypothetical protein